jgi:UDP-N-acetylglucosamine--N-acetylmuramyl-(pentapeptide) pyrophosphoryl-undecaprenol N-acetylglucosamine transferase
MKVVIVCGGTGGHIFPAVALAEELQRRFVQLYFIGTMRGIEEEINRRGYSLEVLPITTVSFRSIRKSFVSIFSLTKSFFRSFVILNKIRPDVVVGFGGYICGPVLSAAYFMRIPILIHEQNVVLGLANRILSRFSNRIAVSFSETKRYLKSDKVVFTGCPIRSSILQVDSSRALQFFDFDEDKFTILVMGGSLGSHRINQVFLDAVRLFEQKNKLQIIHICGKQDYELVNSKYAKVGINARVFAFFEEMGLAYQAADLVISRAGASAIAELTSVGLASILIPYPSEYVHQRENALCLANKDAAILIEEKDLSAECLKEEISKFMQDQQRLVAIGHNAKIAGIQGAAHNLASEVLSLKR